MSEPQRQEIARKYVDKQLRVMKRNGLTTKKISANTYKLLVKRIANTVRT